jgi:hypothetical protein
MLTQKQFGSFKRGNVSVNAELTKARVTEDYSAASAADKKAIRELATAPNFNAVVVKSGTISAKYTAAIAQVLGVSPYYYTGESNDKKPYTGEIMEGFYDKHKEGKPASDKPKAVKKAPVAKKAVPKAAKPAVKVAKSAASKAKAVKAEPKADAKKTATPKIKAAPVAKKAKTAPVTQKAKATPVAKKAKAAPAKAAKSVKAVKPAPAKKPSTPSKADTTLFSIQLDYSAKMNKAVAALDEESVVILLKALSRKATVGSDAEILYDAIKRCLLNS